MTRSVTTNGMLLSVLLVSSLGTGCGDDDPKCEAGAACSMSGSGGTGGSGGAAGTAGSGGSAGTAGMSGGSGGSAGTAGSGGMPSGCTAPLAAPIADCEPAAPATTGDPAQDCVNRINQLRAECQCLPPLMRWTEGEACASEQAEYDAERDDPHAGFNDDICQGGSGQNECPGWGSVQQTVTRCLQQMWDEGPGEPFSEHGHYINMTNPDHDRVACGFFTTAEGDVWAVQNFR